jgi:hypothetical protein
MEVWQHTKISAMKIIDDLEETDTLAVGYFTPNGDLILM